jgi:hypothetical protein
MNNSFRFVSFQIMATNQRQIRLLITARTNALRQHTRQANRFMQLVRGPHDPDDLTEAERVINRLFTDAAEAHERYIIAAGIPHDNVDTAAWMTALRGKNNECVLAIEDARNGNKNGQTTRWTVSDHQQQLPSRNHDATDVPPTLNDHDHVSDNALLQPNDASNVLNSTPLVGENAPPFNANVSGPSAASGTQSTHDDAKRRRLEAEFQIAQNKREQERELEDLKRKQQREHQDLIHRLELEQLLTGSTTSPNAHPNLNPLAHIQPTEGKLTYAHYNRKINKLILLVSFGSFGS